MKYDKTKALNVIVSAAKIFDDKLKDKEILFISKQGTKIVYYEMQFSAGNFKHFTGVETDLSANRLYKLAIDERLSEKNFYFKDSFLVEKKMNVLEAAVNLPYTARMIGDFNYAGIKIQADIGSGNNSYTMGFRKDEKDKLYPVSVLKEDIRKSTRTTSPIIAILSRNIGDTLYNKLTYQSKNVNFDKLHIPKELKAIIATDILQQLKPQQGQEKEEKQPIKATSLKDRIAQKKAIIEQRDSQCSTPHKDKSHNQEL